jgi:hypothetical protein
VDFTRIQTWLAIQVKRGVLAAMKRTSKEKARNIVGSRVRKARLRWSPSVSQEDLAGRLAAQDVTLDRSAISRIESGERYVMDYEVAALAKCLKTSVAWLFGEKD